MAGCDATGPSTPDVKPAPAAQGGANSAGQAREAQGTGAGGIGARGTTADGSRGGGASTGGTGAGKTNVGTSVLKLCAFGPSIRAHHSQPWRQDGGSLCYNRTHAPA